MRAVNLLPKDLRSAGAGGGSGSANGPIALIAVLALAVLLVGAWAYSSRQVKDREAEVARLNAEAAEAEQQAAGLASYETTVKVADTRRTAVVDLINARVDWASALEDVSRTVTDGYILSAMKATTAPGVSVEGSATNPLRQSLSAPAIEVSGCAKGQGDVALLMSRLRSMKNVSKVSLSSSEKQDTDGSGGTSDSAAGATGDGDCTLGRSDRPIFNIVVFYGGAAATGTTTTPGTTSTTTSSTATTSTTPTGSSK